MKFKAILFDCDGLMFESERIWQHYFFEANKKFNLNFTEQDRIKFIGKNEKEIREFLKSINPTCNVDEYRDWMRENVARHVDINGIDAKTGLKNLIKFCNDNNIKMAIVSGSRKVRIQKYLKLNDIDESNFGCFVTGESNLKAKPAPDFYLNACNKLNVKSNECLVLEDSYLGVEAGKNAGCFTIMIPDTMPVTKHMINTADLILNSLNDVISFLEDKNN